MSNQLPYEPKSVEFSIDGFKYTKKEILVNQRNELLFKIIQLGGASAQGLNTLGANIDYGKMLTGVLYKYNPAEMADFIKSTIILGLEFPNFQNMEDSAYESHFTKYYEHQIPVLKEIWEQNFGKQVEEIKKKFSTSKLNTLSRFLMGEITRQTNQEPPDTPDSQTSKPSTGK